MASYKRITVKVPTNVQRHEWVEFKSLPKDLQQIKDNLLARGTK